MFLTRRRKGTEMNFCLVSVTTLFSFFFSWNLTIVSVNGYNGQPPYHIGDVAINCGYHGNSTALDGRHWFGDTGTRLVISMLQPNGKSRSSTADKRSPSADPIPYMTSRISATQFYYTFQVNPGQKFIRLHFYPSSYRGFENSVDFFTVKAGHFTLLRNFSASLAADALGVNYLVKEYCLCVEENKYLIITFAPSQSTKHRSTHAFVNGIEIISMPTGLYYTPDGDLGAHIVGQKNRFYYIDNSTALEMVQRLNIGGSFISPVEDFGMFRRWSEDADYLLESKLQSVNHLVHGIKYTGIAVFTAPLKIYHASWKTGTNGRADKMHNFTWKIPVDLGFGYLVRLHFCDFGLGVTESGRRDFNVLINNQIAEIKADVIRLSGGTGIPIYRDYMVTVKGEKEEGKFDLFIALQSSDKLVVGLLHGLEIFKLSSLDNNLASPNHDLLKQVSRSWNLKTQKSLSVFGNKNAIVTGITILLVLMNLAVFKLRQIWEETYLVEKDTRSESSRHSCRRFSLAEILSATQKFSEALLIGKGGFGRVYKGFISGGSEIVAVKRLKSNSKQGAQEFWTEIETLSKIRHIHLVPLIGYCNENQEMILVYEYMPRGTLADNLYKIGRNGKDGTPLTWEQRLRICIGAARGLDYLHTGIKFGVIHRDVKDSNILLDENLVAKISDFGLSKLGKVSESQSCVSTKVKGTFGYLDPDYFMTHKPTRKTDVYAFGVVMLVVLCGRPAVNMTISGEPQSLLFLFRECVAKGDVANIVDPIMQEKISSGSLNEFVRSVKNCLHPQPRKRPTMSQVVTSLEYALEQQHSIVSSKSEDAATSEQPFGDGFFQPFEVNEFKTSPIHHESAISSPEEGITSKVIQKPELQNRRADLQSTRKPLWVWPWGARWKKIKNLKKEGSFPKDLKEEDSISVDSKKGGGSLEEESISEDSKKGGGSFSKDLKEEDSISEDLKNEGSFSEDLKEEDSFSENGLISLLTISQLQEATDDFSSKYIIMDGRSWLAYMGITKLCEKWCVIYKFKPIVYSLEAQAVRKELELLVQLRHPNLLSVIGYCYHNRTVFVVYERVDNCTSLTTLRSCLYDENRPPLSWIDRIQICIGVAEGLEYLHNGSRRKKRIHGVLRPESILFDCGPEGWPQKWTPLLSAFGCSRLGTITISRSYWSSSLNTFAGEKVSSWCEYLPLDCLSSGPQFTEKNDVYAFGLILLEVLCRKSPGYGGKGRVYDYERYLKTKVRGGIKTMTLHEIIDSNLEGQISHACLSQFLKIAFRCLHDQTTQRPRMGYILEKLKFALFLQENGDGHDLKNVYQEIAGLAEDEDSSRKTH